MPEPVPYYADESVTLYLGDCLNVLRGMPECSVDAIVTDPPAGIGFMAREWDDFRRARNPADVGRDDVFGRTSARGPEYGRRDRDRFVTWLTERLAEAIRVLKPGGHALVWSIPRTAHWAAWAVEDAGFEIRDAIPHIFGSGFPKSRDIGKAIDAEAGAVRDVVGEGPFASRRPRADHSAQGLTFADDSYVRPPGHDLTAPATPEAARWDGWGTALKPGQELWWLARKPFQGTVASNVLEWGTGALNIAACKVEGPPGNGHWVRNGEMGTHGIYGQGGQAGEDFGRENPNGGRWPTNVVFTHSAACQPAGTRRVRGCGGPKKTDSGDGSMFGLGQPGHVYGDHGMETVEAWVCAEDCPVGQLDRQSGVTTSGSRKAGTYGLMGYMGADAAPMPEVNGDTGGASRFYPVFRYQAKAPASERPRLEDGTAHETVKPLGLISWLIRLITPPGGTVLDMFAGSGPVSEAAIVEGFRCVLIEQDAKSAALIRKRLSKPIQPLLFGGDIG